MRRVNKEARYIAKSVVYVINFKRRFFQWNRFARVSYNRIFFPKYTFQYFVNSDDDSEISNGGVKLRPQEFINRRIFFFTNYKSNIRFFICPNSTCSRDIPLSHVRVSKMICLVILNQCSYQTGWVVKWLSAVLHQRPDEQKSYWPSNYPWTRSPKHPFQPLEHGRRRVLQILFQKSTKHVICDVWFEFRTST